MSIDHHATDTLDATRADGAPSATIGPNAVAGQQRPRLQAALEEIAESGFVGVSVRVNDERGEWVGTAGTAELGGSAKPPVDGHVRIASNTKTFTAALVLHMVAEGAIELDRPVADYLTEFGLDPRITVRMLLQHTSGIFNFTGELYDDGTVVLGIPAPGTPAGEQWVAHRFTTHRPRDLVALALSKPALGARPDQPVWTLPEVAGRPGARTLNAKVLGGDSEIVLYARTVRVGSTDRAEYLEIVDANTGRLVDGTVPIAIDIGDRNLDDCVVSANHAAAACGLSGSTDAVLVVDVATSRITETVEVRGDVSRLTAVADRFVFVDRPDHRQSPLLRVLGLDGRELAPLSGTDIASTTPSGQPRHEIELFGLVRLAVVTSAPDPSNPLSKYEFRVIRLEDGAEILRRETVEPLERGSWNVFIDGFVLDDGDTRGIYDRNGTKTADLPAGWRPSQRPYYTDPSPPETSVPIVIKTDGNKTTYAGVSPRNGIVLWEQQSYGADDSPEQLLFHGVGTLITTYEMSRIVDAYSGEYAISAASPDDCTILGTDGTRIAIARDYGSSGNRLEVWDSKGQVWEVTSEHMAVAVGGKVYLGNLRLF